MRYVNSIIWQVLHAIFEYHSKNVFCIRKIWHWHVSVVFWCSVVGVNDTGPATLRGGGPLWNGSLSAGRVPPGATSQLSRRTVSKMQLTAEQFWCPTLTKITNTLLNYSLRWPTNVYIHKFQTSTTVAATYRLHVQPAHRLTYWELFIHLVVCLTTGPKPPPKRFLPHSAL